MHESPVIRTIAGTPSRTPLLLLDRALQMASLKPTASSLMQHKHSSRTATCSSTRLPPACAMRGNAAPRPWPNPKRRESQLCHFKESEGQPEGDLKASTKASGLVRVVYVVGVVAARPQGG
jgi:hypothetical protein